MNTRNFGVALIAGLAFAVLSTASVNAETIEVVGSANSSCSTSYTELYSTDDSPYSAVTVTCPRLPVQVAAVQR